MSSITGKIDRGYEEMLREDEKREARDKPIITEDIVEFCKNRLGFTPFSYQEKLLRDETQFTVARWCRQSGKSHTIASLLLYNALSKPGSRMIVLAPAL